MNPIVDSLASLTPRQTLFVKHLNGLAPLATSIVTPVVANYQFKKSGVGDTERQILVFQEIVRQGISAAIGLASYYGGMFLTGRFFRQPGGQKTLAQIIGGTVMSFVGYGFIRPMVSSEIIARWLRDWRGEKPPLVKQPAQQQGFDGFLHNVQTRAFR